MYKSEGVEVFSKLKGCIAATTLKKNGLSGPRGPNAPNSMSISEKRLGEKKKKFHHN